jgi:pyruvate dehydrogenase (quinone)
MTVSDFVLARLHAWGVRRIYGYPGDGIAIHLLNGLYDAKKDHVPVLAIVGQQARQGLGGNFQQEVDVTTLFKDVAHEYVQQASVPPQARHMVDEAMRIAKAMRAVTCLIFPNDFVLADPGRRGLARRGRADGARDGRRRQSEAGKVKRRR